LSNPLVIGAGIIGYTIRYAIEKGAEYYYKKQIEAANKAGDEGAKKIIAGQADRALAAAPEQQTIELEIKRLEGEVAAGGEGAKEAEAQLKARKIQLEAVKDLEVAAKKYKEFGFETETVIDEFGNESKQSTKRAQEAQNEFFSARKRSNLQNAEGIVNAEAIILTQREKEASILAQRESALNQVSVNEAKIAALQQKILLARTNALADIERARKLIPKELLQSGTGALLDFETEKLKVGQAGFGAAQAGEKAAEARRAVFDQQEVVAAAQTPEDKAAAEDKLAELQEAYEQASAEFYDASNTYNESIKNAAVNTQAALNDIANQIKTKGGPAVTKAFENLQSVLAAQRAGEATGVDAKAAAQSVADTINSELKKQFAANAVAAGDFYAKILQQTSPKDIGEDVSGLIEGLSALKGGGSLEARQEVAADIAPLLEKVKGVVGEDSAAFKEILKASGLSETEYRDIFKDTFNEGIDALKDLPKAVREALKEDVAERSGEDQANLQAQELADEQKRLLDNYVQLDKQLSDFRAKFPTADAVLTAQQKLVKSLEDASKGPEQLATAFQNLEVFGERANTDIKTAEENIAEINESSRQLKEDITGLNTTLREVADIIKVNTDIIKRLGGGGGGTQ
jgi:hypothetical protein